MTADSRRAARAEVERTRAEFARTLDALEDKLNVPKQLGYATQRAKRRAQRLWNENPAGAIAAAVGVAAAVGLTVWLVVGKLSKD